MPTPNRGYPNDLTLASPNNPPAHINALANAIDPDVQELDDRTTAIETGLLGGTPLKQSNTDEKALPGGAVLDIIIARFVIPFDGLYDIIGQCSVRFTSKAGLTGKIMETGDGGATYASRWTHTRGQSGIFELTVFGPKVFLKAGSHSLKFNITADTGSVAINVGSPQITIGG